MDDPRFHDWDEALKKIFNEIDETLEDEYGSRFPLHPARTPRGGTPNPSSNGLFNVGASFSAGYGSRLGRGYVVDVHMSTLSSVPRKIKKEIEERVMTLLEEKLDSVFPDKDLEVSRDGSLIKLHGDLSPP